jgi:hypothetical protein
MFEGVVSQVLDGLLRRYVKGIQKEQLKIGIWKGQSSIPSLLLSSAAFAQPRANWRLSELRRAVIRACPVTAALVLEFCGVALFWAFISVVLLPDHCSFGFYVSVCALLSVTVILAFRCYWMLCSELLSDYS